MHLKLRVYYTFNRIGLGITVIQTTVICVVKVPRPINPKLDIQLLNVIYVCYNSIFYSTVLIMSYEMNKLP